MLENLDSIDWKNIKSGEGTAEEIPQLIRDLRSNDERQCDVTYMKLEYLISQQGSAFEASPLVVPFLLELLAEEDEQICKAQILRLLGSFAGPATYPGETGQWQDAAYEQMVKGLDLYLSLLIHEQNAVRSAAMNILWQPEIYPLDRLPDIAQAMLERIKNESVVWNRVFALSRFGTFVDNHCTHLQQSIPAYAQVVEGIWRSEAELLVQQQAAYTLAEVAEENTPSDLDRFLADMAAHLDFGQVSFIKGILGLWHLGIGRRVAGLAQAMSISSSTDRARTIAEYLLAGVFRDDPLQHPDPRLTASGFYEYPPAREQVDLATLTPEQREALWAVVNTDIIWQAKHNLLEAYGLPSRNVVWRWLWQSKEDLYSVVRLGTDIDPTSMPEKLDTIDWNNIKAGGGTAEEIPQLIRDLRSNDEHPCDETYMELEYLISQQGSAFEASPLVVPFLLELLSDDDAQICKAQILELLGSFAGPARYSGEAAQWKNAAYGVMITGLDLYLSLLTHEQNAVRSAAINILWQPEIYPTDRLPDIAEAFLERIENELVVWNRVFALSRFGTFVDNHRTHRQQSIPAYAQVVESIWRSEAELLVRQQAACTLARVAEESATSDLDRFLTDMAAHVDIGQQAGFTDAILGLWHLGVGRRVPDLAQAIPIAINSVRARMIAEYLLAGVFRDDPLRCSRARLTASGFYEYPPTHEQVDLATLIPEQREALWAVVNTDIIWQAKHNLLEAYGLPSRGEVWRWLYHAK